MFDMIAGGVGITILGGILIGVAIGAMSLLTGRVMSGSSMVGSLLGGAEGVAATSIAFIGGIVAAPLIVIGFGFAQLDVVEPDLPVIVVGGLLVGLSARISGASLGAVMVGIARRRPRALLMLVIMLVGATLGGALRLLVDGGLGA